jgi:replicative DNA helicase
MTRKYIAFDIETAADIPGPDFNWRPHRPIGITCAAIVASDSPDPVVWHGKTDAGAPAARMTCDEAREVVKSLVQKVAEGYTIVTWNGLGFDFDVLAEESGVSSDKIRRGEVRREDFDKFVAASQRLSQVPLYLDDTPALTVSALRTRARRLKRQHGLGLIVVDYLQLLRPTAGGRAIENRVQEISDITRGSKAIAKELNVPVLALAQLSRAVEQREDKRPMLSDLRESGSIEQDADVVMFIFREEYYLSRAEPTRRPEESDEKFNDR